MRLTDDEKRMLEGSRGPHVAKAMDFVISFGDAFDAEKLVDIQYVHYPAEMAIYRGSVEEACEYAEGGPQVCVPTTSSTLACDLDRPGHRGLPAGLYELQARIVAAHKAMGVLGTYTCTPQFNGFVPPKGANIVSVESSAIVWFNSILGARTNRGGFLTRYSAVCGKYPLMGYLLDDNRKGTHLFRLDLAPSDMRNSVDFSALGFHIGAITGSGVPVIDGLIHARQCDLLALGAALATSGSVTLFHAPPYTAEAATVEAAFGDRLPESEHLVTRADLDAVKGRLTNVLAGQPIDFVTLGCPHYTLSELWELSVRLSARGGRVADGVEFQVCTNRFTREAARQLGILEPIERAGAVVLVDSCPVESHMRISTCNEWGLAVPQVDAMVTDSAKMARYVGDLIGCRTALVPLDACIEAAMTGKMPSAGGVA